MDARRLRNPRWRPSRWIRAWLLVSLVLAMVNGVFAYALSRTRPGIPAGTSLELEGAAAALAGWPMEAPSSWPAVARWTEHRAFGRVVVVAWAGVERWRPPRDFAAPSATAPSGFDARRGDRKRFGTSARSSNAEGGTFAYQMSIWGYGWPCAVLARSSSWNTSASGGLDSSTPADGPPRVQLFGAVVVPLVSGAGLLSVVAAWWVAIEWRRRRRGWCAFCRHMLAGSAVCPECGLVR